MGMFASPSIEPCFLFLAVDLAVVKKAYNAATPIRRIAPIQRAALNTSQIEVFGAYRRTHLIVRSWGRHHLRRVQQSKMWQQFSVHSRDNAGQTRRELPCCSGQIGTRQSLVDCTS